MAAPGVSAAASAGRQVPWPLVLAAIWLAWTSNFMVRTALAPGLVGIRADFQLSYGEGGLLASAFLVGYAGLMLPGGLLGDRLGRRRMVLFAALGWSALALLIGLAPSFPVLLVLMGALGAVMGCFNANDRPIVSTVTPRDKMGLGQGITYTGLGVGNGLGLILAGAMAAGWGWRAGFLVFAGLSLVATAALWRTIPSPPAALAPSLRRAARSVLTSRDLWLLFVGGMPSVAAAWLLITWAPTILLEASGVGLADASLLASGVGFAAVPALVGAGMLSDACVRRDLGRKAFAVGGHLLLALALVALAIGVEQRWSAPAVAGLLLAVSFAQWTPWAPAYALLADITPPQAMGMAFGLGATIWSLGALGAPWLAGATRDATGSFVAVFYAIAALALGGAVLTAAVRPAFRLGPERRLG